MLPIFSEKSETTRMGGSFAGFHVMQLAALILYRHLAIIPIKEKQQE